MKDLVLFDVESNDKELYLPKEYYGEYLSGNKYIISTPRKWTKKEEDWVIMLKNKGVKNKDIAKYVDRNLVQVSIKIKRLNKANGETCNEKHREYKYKYNTMFLDLIKPKSVLDLYSGELSFYHGKVDTLVTNDKNKLFNCDYNEDANKLVCKLYYENNKYDLVDIDPFGSPYECLDLSIKMSRKGLIATIGEMGHKRFKRLDFVRTHYSINSIEEFTSSKICDEIIKIGARNKKKLIPIYIADWKGISRIYFKIEKIKVTETWDNKNNLIK
jgi:hypothetical protein